MSEEECKPEDKPEKRSLVDIVKMILAIFILVLGGIYIIAKLISLIRRSEFGTFGILAILLMIFPILRLIECLLRRFHDWLIWMGYLGQSEGPTRPL